MTHLNKSLRASVASNPVGLPDSPVPVKASFIHVKPPNRQARDSIARPIRAGYEHMGRLELPTVTVGG